MPSFILHYLGNISRKESAKVFPNLLSCRVFCFVFEIGSHLAQAGLEPDHYILEVLSIKEPPFSQRKVLRLQIVQDLLMVIRLEPGAPYMLGEHN